MSTDRASLEAFAALPYPVVSFDATGEVLAANPQFGRLREACLQAGGPDPVQLLGKRAGESEAEFEQALRLAEGERCFEVRLKPLGTGILAVLRDITEQKRVEEELRKSEERNRTLLESLPQRIFFKDPEGQFVAVNRAFAADFGLAPRELEGKSDGDLFPPELAAKYRADDLRVMQSWEAETLVESNIVNDTHRYVEVVKAPVLDADGQCLGILGVFTDISERKLMEERLAHERDLLHALMDSMPMQIYFKDSQSRFTRVNRAAAALLDLDDPADAIGKTDFDFYEEPLARSFFEDEQEIVRSGQPLLDKVEAQALPGGGTQHILTTKVPILGADGRVCGIVGISRDISERIRAEETLKRTADELARSNEELQQFAYVASHDLQEPLRMVASYTQLLARRYKDRLDDDANEFIHYAVDGATRMQRLINDLLAYSRVGTQGRPFQQMQLGTALDRALYNLKAAIAESGAEVTSEPLPGIAADESQLVQLFQNLIGNAVKFRGERAPRVHVSCRQEGDEWVVGVHDNGIGIDPQYAERIFIIFQRLHGKTEYSGSGIGLAICKKIVSRHGGRIWVESQAGEGATFYFTLPTRRGAESPEPELTRSPR